MNIKLIVQNAKFFITKNSPTILTGFGVAGLIGTTVTAVRATPKVMGLIDEEVYLKYISSGKGDFTEYVGSDAYDFSHRINKLTSVEILKLSWKPYIPTVILGSISIACIIGANSVNLKRNAVLASLYSATAANLKDYEEKVKQLMGDKKHQNVKDNIAQDRVIANPPSKGDIIFTGKGDTLCMDAYSGRYFRSSVEAIKRAENAINRILLSQDTVSLNDFYYEIDLPAVKIGAGSVWDSESRYDGVNVILSATLTEKQEPCLVIDFDTPPTWIDYL